jgi:predicted nucleic acid-binding protein
MALVTPVFFDTSILLGGSIELGAEAAPAHALLDAVAAGEIRTPHTAWHCCLEFFAVGTRLPAPLRLWPADAIRLLQSEIFPRFRVHQLPANAYLEFLREAERERVAGGRIYDAHIAQIARQAGARTVLTDNRRHFTVLLRDGIRVLTAAEGAAELN